MQLKMSLSIEQVLADAQLLVNRLKDHDGAADHLISTTQTMYRRIDSMKQYEAGLSQLNESGRHRPRSNLILALVKENKQIRQLQQENSELRSCLEEHQSALELIMSKYREQVVKLIVHNNTQPHANTNTASDRAHVDKICEMAAVMQRAARVDEESSNSLRERVSQLETENKTLRELLKISHKHSREVTHMDSNIQVDIAAPAAPILIATSVPAASSVRPRVARYTASDDVTPRVARYSTSDDDGEDSHFVTNDVMNKSVIENEVCETSEVVSEVVCDTSLNTTVEDNNSDNSPNTTVIADNTDSISPNTTVLDNNDGFNSPNTTVLEAALGDITITELSGQNTVSDNSEPGDNTESGDNTELGDNTQMGDNTGSISDNSESGSDNTVSEQTLRADKQSDTSQNDKGAQAESVSATEGLPATGENLPATGENLPATGESLPSSTKKAKGRKSLGKASTTIKRGKGKSILHDLNANTGAESEQSPAIDSKVTKVT